MHRRQLPPQRMAAGSRGWKQAGRRVRHAFLSGFLLLAVVMPFVVSAPPASADHRPNETKGVFQHVASVPRLPSDGDLGKFLPGYSATSNSTVTNSNAVGGGFPLISPAMDRLYQIIEVRQNAVFRVAVLIRDLEDPTKLLHAFLLPSEISTLQSFPGPMTFTMRGQLAHAIDPEEHKIYLPIAREPFAALNDYRKGMLVIDEHEDVTRYGATYTKLGVAPEDVMTSGDPLVGYVTDEVDAGRVPNPNEVLKRTPSVGDPRFFETGTLEGDPYRWEGIQFLNGRLYVLLGRAATPNNAPLPLRIAELDPSDFSIRWDRTVRGCQNQYLEQTGAAGGPMGWIPLLHTGDALYVPCISSSNAVVVRLSLDQDGQPGPANSDVTFAGTGIPFGYIADQAGQRIHFRVQAPQGPAVLSFDAETEIFVGLQAVGDGGTYPKVAWALDESTGRIYTQVGAGLNSGLARLDGRTTPVGTALRFEAFTHKGNGSTIPTMLARDSERGRLFALSNDDVVSQQKYIILEDDPPVAIPDKEDPDRLTADVEERPGVTDAAYSGAATAYGVRTMLINGLSSVVPNRITNSGQMNPNTFRRSQCQRTDREVVLARVENLQMQNSGPAGLSIASDADENTRQDLESPSRCSDPGETNETNIVENAVLNAIGERAPWLRDMIEDQLKSMQDTIDDQGDPWPFPFAACKSDAPAESVGPNAGPDPEDRAVDLAVSGFVASVDCSDPRALTGAATAEFRTVALEEVSPEAAGGVDTATGLLPDQVEAAATSATGAVQSVSVAHSSVRTSTVLDPKRGTVSRSEALVKGIKVSLPGVLELEIGGIYALAETWAKGRPGTNGTRYERVMWGVRGTGPDGVVRCGLCAGEAEMAQLESGLNSLLGDRGSFAIGTTNPELQKGTPGGYQAAVKRNQLELINAEVVNGDDFTEVPVAELVLFNDSLNWGRSRQVFQFAGVEANSQYGIFCLDGVPEGGRCVSPPLPPSSLEIELVDGGGLPLAGGVFTAAGPETHSCTTDVSGRCLMTDLEPGDYTVTETQAPEGYMAAPDLTTSVFEGGSQTARFINLRNAGRIVISLQDAESGSPLEGGVFEVTDDAGTVVASCTTTADGACQLATPGTAQPLVDNEVPLGSYVVEQTVAPRGYEPAEGVAFTLENPGDVAELAFTNGGQPTAVLSLGGGQSVPAAAVTTTGASGPGGFLGPIAEGLRWLFRHPFQALVLGATVVMFGAPFWQSWRRRLLLGTSTVGSR